MIKRRHFIKAAGAASVVSALPLVNAGQTSHRGKMNVLFMGGTGFIGPHMVRAMVAQGHNVTLFNRGKSNPHLFQELEKIKGDRLSADDLAQLSNRKWDLIVDSSCYIPRAVNMLMEAVSRDTIKQYIFISTISVYKNFSGKGLHEGSALATMDDPASEDVGKWYGALKVLCERAAEKALPERVTNLRCGLIIGPGDSTDRFTYWPERIAHGGEVLAPGTGDDHLQTIDVRDLADWVALCASRNITGTYNSTNPAGLYQFRDVLNLCKQHLNSNAKLTWVPADFLKEQHVQEMRDLPLWVAPNGPMSGIWHANSDLATSKGMKHRPLAESIVDTHKWFQSLPKERQEKRKAGMSLQREQEILAAWHRHIDS